MPMVFENNLEAVTAAAITAADSIIPLQPGHGARFPTISNGDYLVLTLAEQDGLEEVDWEIVHVTAVSGDNLTVTRGHEGTPARVWNSGTRAEARMTAGTAAAFEVTRNWGNHNTAGYLTEEVDPFFSASPAASITTDNINTWNTQASYGNHATQGYLTSVVFNDIDAAAVMTSAEPFSPSDSVLMTASAINSLIESKGYITSQTDSQTLGFNASTGVISISDGNSVDLDGRWLLNSVPAAGISNTDLTQWDTAYSYVANMSFQSVASGTTVTLDMGSKQNFEITLSNATVALAFSNLAAAVGKSGMIALRQDATGGRTFTLPTAAKTPLGGATIAQHTTANSLSALSYVVLSPTEVLVNYIGNYA